MAALLDIVTKGSTDRSVTIRIIDSTDGTPETGVVFNTAGIDLWYRREGAALTSITEATQTVSGAHADGGFVHIGNGEYRLDLPDAAFASGANYVDVGGTVTGMIVLGGRVRLVDVNLEDSVRAGLTALPNAAAAASGGLFTRGTGAGQINQDANGRVDVNIAAIGGTAGNATNLASSTSTIVRGTVDDTGFTPTTSIFESDDITTATTGHYIGRLVIFTSGTLAGQAARITAYSLSSGRGRFTVTTLTSAPANNVTFVVV